jgi:hypothetical protein
VYSYVECFKFLVYITKDQSTTETGSSLAEKYEDKLPDKAQIYILHYFDAACK